jgi:hypothetical protein
MADNPIVVSVRRWWNSRKIATYRFSEISGLYWDNMSGGVDAVASQYFVYGYVWCDRMISGELSHSCRHGEGPHRIKVCLTKTENELVWSEITKIVGAKPSRGNASVPRKGIVGIAGTASRRTHTS